jgi:hypothetical protein
MDLLHGERSTGLDRTCAPDLQKAGLIVGRYLSAPGREAKGCRSSRYCREPTLSAGVDDADGLDAREWGVRTIRSISRAPNMKPAAVKKGTASALKKKVLTTNCDTNPVIRAPLRICAEILWRLVERDTEWKAITN